LENQRHSYWRHESKRFKCLQYLETKSWNWSLNAELYSLKLLLVPETYKEKSRLFVLKIARLRTRNYFISTRMGRLWYGSRKKVVSAFSGPADANSFDLITHTQVRTL
jgi:hypothetical protein